MTLPLLPRPARALTLVFALLMASAAGVPHAARAGSAAASPITVERPWTRATPGGSAVTAGYVVIRNAGDQPDRLLAARSDIAGAVGPHTMTMLNGVMRMRPLAEGLVIPAHGTVTLAPGGDHLMFEALKHPLRTGDKVEATLVFERAGPLAVTFTVEAIGAKAPGSAIIKGH